MQQQFQQFQQKSQQSLAQTYTKKLQDQNKAKTQQISLLREQLSKSSSITQQTNNRLITYTSTLTTCAQCKNKDSQIVSLKQLVQKGKKQMEEFVSKNRGGQYGQGGHVQGGQVQGGQEKIVYKEVIKEVESSKSKQEIQRLRKENQNIRKLYEEVKVLNQGRNNNEKVEWTTIRVDNSGNTGNTGNNQEMYLLRQENNVLIGKIQFLEQRLASAEESNRVLRNELLGQPKVQGHAEFGTKNWQQVSSPFSYPIIQQQERPKVWITSNLVPPVPSVAPVSFAQPAQVPVVHITSTPLPTFKNLTNHLPSKTVTFQMPHSTSLSSLTPDQTQPSHLSPLSVLNPHALHTGHHTNCQNQSHHPHHSHYRTHHHHHNHNHSQYFHDRSFSQAQLNTSQQVVQPMDYYKDIVEQRWKSLQYKIKMLEQENGKLRSQVTAVYI